MCLENAKFSRPKTSIIGYKFYTVKKEKGRLVWESPYQRAILNTRSTTIQSNRALAAKSFHGSLTRLKAEERCFRRVDYGIHVYLNKSDAVEQAEWRGYDYGIVTVKIRPKGFVATGDFGGRESLVADSVTIIRKSRRVILQDR